MPFTLIHNGTANGVRSGLLALFRLSKYVRINILGDIDTGKDRSISSPKNIIYQQGELILKKIDEMPKDKDIK